jgi:TRAP-type C4-dicarboxylate transport system permease small subunit
MTDPTPPSTASGPAPEAASAGQSSLRRKLLIEDRIGAVLMAVLALITFANVVVRYLTDQSFAWTEELSVVLMVLLTMVAASAAIVRNSHVRIEVLLVGGSPARQRALESLAALASVIAWLLISGLGSRLAWDDYRFDVTTPGIGLPQWWYTVWLPVLALLLAARSMQQLVRLWAPPK